MFLTTNTTLNHGGFRNGKINKRSVRKIQWKMQKRFFFRFVLLFAPGAKKRCKKNLKIDDDSIIYEVIVEFYDKYESFKKAGSVPTLIINKCVPTGTEGVYSVHEIHREEVGEIVTRKTVKILQELTEGYTDEKLVDMIKMLIAA